MNTEQILSMSPTQPTHSSIITRVAAATFNSINTQGNNSTGRISESSLEGSGGNNPSSSPNGDTITEMRVTEKRSTLKERKGSIVFGERRMTIKGWPFNRNRSTTQ